MHLARRGRKKNSSRIARLLFLYARKGAGVVLFYLETGRRGITQITPYIPDIFEGSRCREGGARKPLPHLFDRESSSMSFPDLTARGGHFAKKTGVSRPEREIGRVTNNTVTIKGTGLEGPLSSPNQGKKKEERIPPESSP